MKKIKAKKNQKINQVENGLVALQEYELESVVGGFLPPDLEDLMNKSKENPTSPSIENNRWRNLA
ncbi:MAG: hypothetical protein F6K25_01670 [Okeania sp. SIO2G4]|uniref:hypothetical protein n=1 Tax=unclassified Okeania TaxID=2634635 RepID=UPI0013BDE5DE|nr:MULTISPECIES: hypothetical protein [unclassified Okeania]NEP39611.1 hypothetical protein [Okeania sp. SIO2H7]NEP73280.1 hypothetical protein [Okeania sp. SIO2G5]NEP91696.1 hypothetical protein [Okeania sp. SIO2F5]NEQ89523.1 hypothetical protein [Okeania sp. SIO2G4]